MKISPYHIDRYYDSRGRRCPCPVETVVDDEVARSRIIGSAYGWAVTVDDDTWAMFLLASHPRWQEMVREEVVREYPAHRLPIGDALGKLKLVCYARTYSHLLNYIWCI